MMTKKQLVIPARIESFDEAEPFVEELLAGTHVNREIAQETMLVFETVFSTVVAQDLDDDTVLAITPENRLGSLDIKIGYEGKRFAMPEEGEMEPELKLMEGFADKISYSYRSGYNIIRISVQKTPRAYFVSCGIGVLLALVAYALISLFVDPETQKTLCTEYIFPFEKLISNAVLMVGAPVTFFSLLKNASDVFIVSERTSHSRQLLLKTLSTSIFAILLAVGVSFVFAGIFHAWKGIYAAYGGGTLTRTFSEIVISMVPSSIFEPFEVISPIPLIVVALLVTYALCSAGKDFEALKTAIDGCYGLFSHMLSAIMVATPVACFLGILDILLKGGLISFVRITLIIVIAIVSVYALLGAYALRLRAHGVDIKNFTASLVPLLRENRAIGSVIDAAPYNVRYCARVFGMNRKKLQESLPILAQINLDGNCYIITLIAMLVIFLCGIKVSWVNIVIIGALILLLSFGAPNQPGSILIGSLIIITYLNATDLLCIAFYLEASLSGIQNLINVISCIVTVTEEQGIEPHEDKEPRHATT